MGVIGDGQSGGLVEEEDRPVLVAVVGAVGKHEISQDMFGCSGGGWVLVFEPASGIDIKFGEEDVGGMRGGGCGWIVVVDGG